MDMLLNVTGRPWKDLGNQYKESILSSEEIVKQGNLDWTVSALPMRTDRSDPVQGYHAIYRDDTQSILGVVNNRYPSIVQNVDSFLLMEPLMKEGLVSLDISASYMNGKSIFGTFKLTKQYEVLGDKVDHYFIVVNDHTKPDGKVFILNTPIRIACQNALSHAISNSVYKLRMPVISDRIACEQLSTEIYNSADTAIATLNQKAEKLASQKITQSGKDKLMDELFPYIDVSPDDMSIHDKANETVEMMRSQFEDCLNASNLIDFKGTAYQMYNAIVDLSQHYYKNADKGYDLNYKMSMLPGIGNSGESQSIYITKFFKILPSIIAA